MKAEVEDSSLLQEVISGRPNNTPFIIKLGNINDLQKVEIPGHKKIMLKADRAVTLKCPKKDQNEHKHLQVNRDATLILEGLITLQGTDYKGNTQYALYVENGGKAEIKNGVTITGFKNGNRGPVVSDGNLTMPGGTITGNQAKRGGGVYIHGYVTMKDGKITKNTATHAGKAAMIDHDFYWNGGEIKDNIGSVQPIGYEGGAGNDFHNNTNPHQEPS